MAMGSGALFSYYFGRKEEARMKSCMRLSFLLIGGVTVALNLLVMAFCCPVSWGLRTAACFWLRFLVSGLFSFYQSFIITAPTAVCNRHFRFRKPLHPSGNLL